MSSETREKQALVVFLLLVVLGMSGLIWYLFAGHSWNVAASNIDDSVGQMEGYTAILYAGTMPEKASTSAKSTSSSNASDVTFAESQNTTSTVATQNGSGEISADSETGAEPSGAVVASSRDSESRASEKIDAKKNTGGLASEHASESSDSTAESETAAAEVTDSAEVESPSSSSDDSSSSAIDADTAQKSLVKTSRPSIGTDEVRDSYEEKGAGVLVLDLAQPDIYSEGTIVKRGGRRIGIISITRPLNEVLAKRILNPFHEAKVDMVVCIAPEKSYLSGISGFDVVVCTSDDSVSVIGETSNKTFFVNAPTIGSVGATVVSPSNVVSAKVIDSL